MIAEVKEKFGVPLSEIAKQIGDGHGTVQKLYRGLMVLQQAERNNVYDPDDRQTPRIYFSHLYTGLEYEGFSSFLGLSPKEDESPNPVSKERLKELGELCVWLFGSKKQERDRVIRSQNPDLRQLDEVVKNPEALAALRADESLARAFELTHPPSHNLEEYLLEAKRALMRAKSYVPDGYDNSERLLKHAGSVANIADAIYLEMEKMHSGGRRSRIEPVREPQAVVFIGVDAHKKWGMGAENAPHARNRVVIIRCETKNNSDFQSP